MAGNEVPDEFREEFDVGGKEIGAQILHGPEEGELTVTSREQQDHAAIRRLIDEYRSDLGQTMQDLALRGKERRL